MVPLRRPRMPRAVVVGAASGNTTIWFFAIYHGMFGVYVAFGMVYMLFFFFFSDGNIT